MQIIEFNFQLPVHFHHIETSTYFRPAKPIYRPLIRSQQGDLSLSPTASPWGLCERSEDTTAWSDCGEARNLALTPARLQRDRPQTPKVPASLALDF